MSPNPESFLHHLQKEGYHPRSDKHSNSLSEAIATDLAERCRAITEKAAKGDLVYDLNFTVKAGTSDWNVDLVLGPPPPGIGPPEGASRIRRTRPSTVEIAVEIKSVMTEHRKAVKNRKRDFEAHHEHVHRYSNQVLAAGVLVVNMATRFKSPLKKKVTLHKNVEALIEHCIQQMRGVTSRQGLEGEGVEAKSVIVLDMDNVDLGSSKFITRSPAPPIGDPLHYDAFIQTVCAIYSRRFPS